MNYFCTYFDRNYLLRGLTMYRSLVATGLEFTLFVLPLDDFTYNALLPFASPQLRLLPLSELETSVSGLLDCKANRSVVEYYFTLSPVFPLYLLDTQPGIDVITYLDSDLYFYASPGDALSEISTGSVLTTGHRYPPRHSDKERFGRFNVQFQSFRNDSVGRACLLRWQEQCIEWCYDRVEGTRYADQKYLDEWPSMYGDAIVVVAAPGVGVAPWNIEALSPELSDGRFMVEGSPVIFYHFHGLKLLNSKVISNGLADWARVDRSIQRFIYGGYVRKLRETRDWLKQGSGVCVAMQDRLVRGGGIRSSSLPEIARKLWAQLMFVP